MNDIFIVGLFLGKRGYFLNEKMTHKIVCVETCKIIAKIFNNVVHMLTHKSYVSTHVPMF